MLRIEGARSIAMQTLTHADPLSRFHQSAAPALASDHQGRTEPVPLRILRILRCSDDHRQAVPAAVNAPRTHTVSSVVSSVAQPVSFGSVTD